ncbi:MAG: lipoxygenase [Myxococcales bacterium]|nr:lipoxygenase [Myxococcales bacterium]
MAALLPQDDPGAAARRSELERQRRKYTFKYTHLEPLALLNELPRADKPTLRWWVAVFKILSENKANARALKRAAGGGGILSFSDEEDADAGEPTAEDARLEELLADAERVIDGDLDGLGGADLNDEGPLSFGDSDPSFWERVKQRFSSDPAASTEGETSVRESVESSLVGDLETSLADFEGTFASKGPTTTRLEGVATSLADYDALYLEIPLPAIRRTFQEDRAFARMRLAGPNPVMLERVTAPARNFPVTDERYRQAMGDKGDSLAAAGAEGRLFQVDYGILDGLPDGTFPGPQKRVVAPIALFAVPRESAGADRALRPVAIQTAQRPSDDAPVLGPRDGEAWQVAKTAVQIADGCVHEAVTHLARTHLFVEPFVVATRRQLSRRHPLQRLLDPHFEGTLYINNAAANSLIAPEGGVNRLLSPTIGGARLAVVLGLHSYPFDQASLERQLAARGVGDPATLPDYPYRDDARLLWAAIHAWVREYVAVYYRREAEVRSDSELQAWAAELVAYDGGRVRGFGQDGGIKTVDYLVEALTLLIFTASAQHAAVNFPQGTLMAYAPAMPLAAYAPVTPTTKWFELLPPLEQALFQAELGRNLGLVYHTRLGQYDRKQFDDTQVKEPLYRFQNELERVEATIQARNQRRDPYTFLLPSEIPQSINI